MAPLFGEAMVNTAEPKSTNAIRRANPGSILPEAAEGDIADRLERIGLDGVSAGALTVTADYADFEDFWEPFTLGVGPAGRALSELDDESRAAVREAIDKRISA